ncbi:MAG TPA: hypothetical protein VLG38_06555 [Gammaproteobacteria bacterium]|nr:hypothetical protein [Gammaproteobacteria bacterium]
MLTSKKLAAIGLVLTAALVLSACHPRVEPNSDLDKELSCSELRSEIARVKETKAKIEKSRGFSGRNVGLAILWWPGIVINETTGESAANDADRRLAHLQHIYARKQCSKGSVKVAQAKKEQTKSATASKG